jgi:hypothetical protein
MDVRTLSKRLQPRRPSPAMVVAIIALVVACAGTATAARLLITSPTQIKSNVISSRHIHNGTIAGIDLKSGTITAKQLKKSLLKGSTIGANSTTGLTAHELIRKKGPENIAENRNERIAGISGLAPGAYAIFAKTTITSALGDLGVLSELIRGDKTSTAHCRLDAAGDVDDAYHPIATPYAELVSTINLQITRTFGSPGDVSLSCEAGNPWRASDTSIVAIPMGRVERNTVGG